MQIFGALLSYGWAIENSDYCLLESIVVCVPQLGHLNEVKVDSALISSVIPPLGSIDFFAGRQPVLNILIIRACNY